MNHDSRPQFRWLERGDGEPVVLLHGLMGHMDHWDATLDALAGTVRLLAPELPVFEPAFPDVSLVALAARSHNLEPLLSAIRVPTLLVWGEDDRVTPPEVARRFHRLIPRSRLVLLPRCGHAPMLEQAEAFNAVLDAWLRETRRARTRATAVEAAR